LWPRRQSNPSTAIEPERALLNQVEERDAVSAVPLRYRDDEPQVRLDHVLARSAIAAFDSLGERQLLDRREELVPADAFEEEMQRLEARRRRLGPGRLRLHASSLDARPALAGSAAGTIALSRRPADRTTLGSSVRSSDRRRRPACAQRCALARASSSSSS
jgi:hypothetical protein